MTINEMMDGYRDGFNLDNPEPSENRSYSYRHGFKNGRADITGNPAFATGQASRDRAIEAIAKDEAA